MTDRSRVETRPAHGVWAPALTPLDENLLPDPARYVAHARRLLDEGCHGVAVFGTTGEATSFSADERMALLEGILEAGLPADRLMVGTGCPALTDTVRLTAHAVSMGCVRVLMLPPYYFKGVSDDGLFASYDTVIQRVGSADLRIVLYHFPRLSGVPVTPGLIERLLQVHPETVVGIKDSSGEWASTRSYIDDHPALAVMPGSETLLLDGLMAGGTGCITATANVNAGGIRKVFDAWLAGDDEAARRHQDDASRIRAHLARWPLVPGLKAALASRDAEPGWLRMRPPLTPLADTEVQRLLEGLAEAAPAAA
jgi:4-hydroxy-tetrahydrodipicolinate synthase